jgi:hypothetical protein
LNKVCLPNFSVHGLDGANACLALKVYCCAGANASLAKCPLNALRINVLKLIATMLMMINLALLPVLVGNTIPSHFALDSFYFNLNIQTHHKLYFSY